jgi:hypothetical protein
MTDRRLLGFVEVDSGTLIIGDPVYVLGHQTASRPGVDYEAVIEVIAAVQGPVARLAGQPVLLLQEFGGDGSYPVYGEFEDDMLVRVIVEFVEPEE